MLRDRLEKLEAEHYDKTELSSQPIGMFIHSSRGLHYGMFNIQKRSSSYEVWTCVVKPHL